MSGIHSSTAAHHLKFFGFANRSGERKRVFLSQDGDVFIAGEGETVNRRYKVLRIGVNSVDIQDVLNNTPRPFHSPRLT